MNFQTINPHIASNRNYSNLAFGSKSLNIFYFSDFHGIIPAYRYLKSASDEFDENHDYKDSFKLAGGDVLAETDPKKRLLTLRILGSMGVDASAVGNHDCTEKFDFFESIKNIVKNKPEDYLELFRPFKPVISRKYLAEVADLFNANQGKFFTNFITCNTETDKVKSKEYKETGLFQSKIVKKNGDTYGLIGATTPDYVLKYCKVHGMEDLKKDINREIGNLKKKDHTLNKVVLLSHLGFEEDQQLAKELQDIDIIIGGHSHTKVEGIKEGYNLFRSKKGEPVIIAQSGPKIVTQAGNERTFGTLTVNFDKDGIIDLSKGNMPQNHVESIYDYRSSSLVEQMENEFLGKSEEIGVLKRDFRPEKPLVEENPIANITADAVLKETHADFALMNAGSYRSYLIRGPITARDVEYCLPMPSPIVTTKYNKQQIVDALKWGAESTKLQKISPGIFHAAGLRYTITRDKDIKDVYTVNEKGERKTTIVDSKGKITPGNDEFTVATTEYMLTGPAKLDSLKKTRQINGLEEVDESQIIKRYDTHRDILINYIKKTFKNKNIDVDTNRITIQ